ncbi:MAG: DUF4388 domain-containing protein [Phormidesmis sp.]
MNLQGLTSEFSLPELFKFLQESQQTGRLSLKPIGSPDLEERAHYLWFEKGNLLAASSRLDGLGLLNILQKRALIQNATLPQLLRRCPADVALGKFLEDCTILTSKQLKSLFASQVLRHTCVLLESADVQFAFHALSARPYLEMTGVRIRATDITLPSLRLLKNWGALLEKLPSPDSGLKPLEGDIPTYRLHSQEKDVLRLAKKGLSLSKVARVLQIPTLEVQKIGFRLIFVGLVKEVPLVQFAKPVHQPKKRISTRISTAFLSRLSNYLQKTPAMSRPEVSVPIFGNSMLLQSTSIGHKQRVNEDKASKNSAVKRVTNILSIDRAERLPENVQAH